MTYSNMRDYFLILQDKFGSPYYTDDEIALFMNRGQLDTVVSLFPIDGSEINAELNANTVERIAPLIVTHQQPIPSMTGAGLINKASLETDLGGLRVLRMLAINYNGKPCRYTNWNRWASYIANTFKAGSASYPRYTETASNYSFDPIDANAIIYMVFVRYPAEMLPDNSVDCELPDFTHNDVVSRALELAGVGSRDQMLSELKQLNKV